MAKFEDLSNEIVIALGSHLDKPSNSRSLANVNQRMKGLMIPLLFENIVLDRKHYNRFLRDNIVRGNIYDLLHTLGFCKPKLGSTIRTLDVSVESIR